LKRFALSAIVVALFVAATFGIWRYLIHPGCYWAGHDLRFGLERIAVASRCIADGQLFPRWAGELYGGYGYPLLHYYPPLFTMIAAWLHLAGLPVLAAMKILAGIITGIGALFTWLWLRPRVSPFAAFAGAFLFATFPYHRIVLTMRGALAEYLALSMFPALLWALDRENQGGAVRWRSAAALTFAALMLSHNASFLFFVPGALGYAAVVAWDRGRLRGLIQTGSSLAAGLGLSAFYWVPAFFEKNLVQIDRLLTADNVNFRQHFVSWNDLINPAWPFGGLGPVLLVAALISPLAILSVRKRGFGRMAWFLPVAAASYTLLTMKFAQPLWDAFPPLQYVGYPWRLFGAAGLFAAGSLALVIDAFEQWTGRLPAAAAVLLLTAWLAGTPPLLGHFQLEQFNERVLLAESSIRRSTTSTIVADEYAPLWVKQPPHTVLGIAEQPAVSQAGATVVVERSTSREVSLIVDAPSELQLRLNMIYFPGWEVILNGQPAPIRYGNESGLMEVSVPVGTHQIDVLFYATPLRLAASALSLTALVIGFVVCLVNLVSRLRPARQRLGGH